MELLNDFSTSVRKAFEEIDPEWESYKGLVVCGTHSPHDWEEMIEKIRQYRIAGLPFLGICFGHQLAAIEYARNVLGQKNSTSQEFYPPNVVDGGGNFIVRRRPEGLKVGLHEGETYWNNYEVVPGFESIWKKADNFITCQYHPEYQSSKDRPHRLLKAFLDYARS